MRLTGKRPLAAEHGSDFRDFLAGYDALSADKGNGLRVLKKHLLLSDENCAAFGDNFNDLEMLQEVTYGFAWERPGRKCGKPPEE